MTKYYFHHQLVVALMLLLGVSAERFVVPAGVPNVWGGPAQAKGQNDTLSINLTC